jgi:hypothetical protein
MRALVGIDLGREPAPDEITVCKSRHLLERAGRGLDVSVGKEGSGGSGDEGEQRGGDDVSCGKEDAEVIEETANDGGCRWQCTRAGAPSPLCGLRLRGGSRWRICTASRGRRRSGRSGRCRGPSAGSPRRRGDRLAKFHCLRGRRRVEW